MCMAGIFVKLDQLRNGERPARRADYVERVAEGKRAGPDGPTAPGVEHRGDTDKRQMDGRSYSRTYFTGRTPTRLLARKPIPARL